MRTAVMFVDFVAVRTCPRGAVYSSDAVVTVIVRLKKIVAQLYADFLCSGVKTGFYVVVVLCKVFQYSFLLVVCLYNF